MTAGATNSSCRGVLRIVAVEAAASLQLRRRVLTHLLTHARRAGAGLYGGRGVSTLWAGLMALAWLMVLLTIEQGALWREREGGIGGTGRGSQKRALGGGLCNYSSAALCV